MSRRERQVQAKPLYLRLDENGYYLVMRVTHGPAHLIGRSVTCAFSHAQITKVDEWDGPGRLDLEDVK